MTEDMVKQEITEWNDVIGVLSFWKETVEGN